MLHHNRDAMKPTIHTDAGVYVGAVHAQKYEGLLRATHHNPQMQVCHVLVNRGVDLVLGFGPIAFELPLQPLPHCPNCDAVQLGNAA